MKTVIQSIPQREHRYSTLGDYWTARDGAVYISVTELADWRYEFLVGIHELIEEALTRHRGIAEPVIVQFDVDHPDLDDPGMSPCAPYHREHVTATSIEMLLAQELGVDWEAYGKACQDALEECVSKPYSAPAPRQ